MGTKWALLMIQGDVVPTTCPLMYDILMIIPWEIDASARKSEGAHTVPILYIIWARYGHAMQKKIHLILYDLNSVCLYSGNELTIALKNRQIISTL